MAHENAQRDENRETTLLAVTNDSNLERRKLRVDPDTDRLLTNVVGDVTLAAGTNNIGDVDVLTMPNVTLAAGTNTNEVVGDVAHDAVVAGNPVLGGAEARGSLGTAVASGDAVRISADRYGRQHAVKPVVSTGSSAGTAITTNTNTSIVSAPSSGNHLRIWRLWAQNSSATGTWCYWGNGSGVKTIPFYLAQYQPFSMDVGGQWDLSTATALYMNTATTGANIEWFVEYETVAD